MTTKKQPSELEPGDVYKMTIGFDDSTAYVTNTHGNKIAFSKFTWQASREWVTSVEELEDDSNYMYLGRVKPLWERLLTLGGLIGKKYEPVYEEDEQ